MKKTNRHNPRKSLRQRLLDSPAPLMPLPEGTGYNLKKMGFRTVREAFRAALAGRLGSRKQGGALLEDSVLEAGCTMLGHPVLTRKDIREFLPREGEKTVADAIFRFNGRRPELSRELLSTSIRNILLPSAMHNGISGHAIKDLGKLLSTRLSDLLEIEGIGTANLGLFLAQIFDYVFILNEQETSAHKHEFDPTHLNQEQPANNSGNPLSSLFDEEMLDRGAKLLNSGQPEYSLFHRNAAGAIFEDEDIPFQAYLLFENGISSPSGELKLSYCHCDRCYPSARHQHRYCHHIAALALHISKPAHSEDIHDEPAPIFFRNSPWLLIGQILFELFGQDGAEGTNVRHENSSWVISVPGVSSQPWAEWWLNDEIIARAAALFGNRFRWIDPPPTMSNAPILGQLRDKLLETTRTSAEIELNTFDHNRPLIQERDESVWFWLAEELCRIIPLENLNLVGPDEDGLFNLTGKSAPRGRDGFRIALPRAKTPDLVDIFNEQGIKKMLLPPAEAMTRIEMEGKGFLVAASCLRLDDGRILTRRDLESSLYGRYYYLEDKGFLPVLEQEEENTLGDPRKGPVRYHANKVPGILQKHQKAFSAPENEIAPTIQEFNLVETPDLLDVSSFETDSNWCYLSGHYGLGNRKISLVELLAARLENDRYLPTEDSWLKLTDSPLEWFHNLGEDRLWSDATSGTSGVRLTRREMFMLSALVPELRTEESTRGRDTLLQLLDTDNWVKPDQLENLPEHLRDYQRHGIAWLYQLYQNRLAGILADDMGLGKTHQALGLLDLIMSSPGSGRFLIVCPATVVPHWVEKIDSYFPRLSHYVYHGSRRDLDKAGDSRIFITTYGIIRRDTKELAAYDFEIIIFDEIQQLKNKKTDVSKAAARLGGQVIIGLTGTPLENSVYDLKAIFDICLPGFLGSDHDFRNRYAETISSEDSRDTGSRESLARLINPFLLRRTREQVLQELPDVIEDFRTCELSNDQVSLYRQLISGRARSILDKISPEDTDGQSYYMELLAVINYLKQVCNHPCLVKKCSKSENFESGKWNLFVELLHECLDASMKVVVFSHYTKMLDIIEDYLTENNIKFCGLRGDMTMNNRYDMIRKFNTDDSYKVFSASLLAGGVGVDLTAAQAVIHYDRWWNAAREDQATARVHRMGQKHVVQVFKLITVGTLEEKIHKMINRKRDLAGHLVKKDDASIIKHLRREDLIDLLSASPP